MAIVYDNKYNRIIKSTLDFENNITKIEMKVYDSKESRQREKDLKDLVNFFCQKVQQLLANNINNLIEETNKIQSIETITDREKFLANHPLIKAKVEEQESIQKEGLYLIDKLLKENINFSKLKYLSIWKSLGLKDEFCSKINILGISGMSVDNIRESNLSSLYSAVKEKIVSPILDC